MKLIWTRTAVEAHDRGVYDPRHTISNVTPSSVESFTRQFRAGCPWIITDDDGNVLEDSRANHGSRRAADDDRAGGRNTLTRFADEDACTP